MWILTSYCACFNYVVVFTKVCEFSLNQPTNLSILFEQNLYLEGLHKKVHKPTI